MTEGPGACPRCGGVGTIQYGRRLDRPVVVGHDVAIVAITADVCERCGETLLHPGMVDRLIAAKRDLRAGALGPPVGHVYELRNAG
jgi:YgiT-type zinc finger domain-containing protein